MQYKRITELSMDLFLSILPFMFTNEMELLNAQYELFLMVLN